MYIGQNAVCVTRIADVEPGDVIARHFLGGVISGEVTGIAAYPFQLNDEQRQYMRDNNLRIPEGEYELLDSPTRCLVLGEFWNTNPHFPTVGSRKESHMYVDNDTTVAVFPAAKISNELRRKRLEELAEATLSEVDADAKGL